MDNKNLNKSLILNIYEYFRKQISTSDIEIKDSGLKKKLDSLIDKNKEKYFNILIPLIKQSWTNIYKTLKDYIYIFENKTIYWDAVESWEIRNYGLQIRKKVNLILLETIIEDILIDLFNIDLKKIKEIVNNYNYIFPFKFSNYIEKLKDKDTNNYNQFILKARRILKENWFSNLTDKEIDQFLKVFIIKTSIFKDQWYYYPELVPTSFFDPAILLLNYFEDLDSNNIKKEDILILQKIFKDYKLDKNNKNKDSFNINKLENLFYEIEHKILYLLYFYNFILRISLYTINKIIIKLAKNNKDLKQDLKLIYGNDNIFNIIITSVFKDFRKLVLWNNIKSKKMFVNTLFKIINNINPIKASIFVLKDKVFYDDINIDSDIINLRKINSNIEDCWADLEKDLDNLVIINPEKFNKIIIQDNKKYTKKIIKNYLHEDNNSAILKQFLKKIEILNFNIFRNKGFSNNFLSMDLNISNDDNLSPSSFYELDYGLNLFSGTKIFNIEKLWIEDDSINNKNILIYNKEGNVINKEWFNYYVDINGELSDSNTLFEISYNKKKKNKKDIFAILWEYDYPIDDLYLTTNNNFSNIIDYISQNIDIVNNEKDLSSTTLDIFWVYLNWWIEGYNKELYFTKQDDYFLNDYLVWILEDIIGNYKTKINNKILFNILTKYWIDSLSTLEDFIRLALLDIYDEKELEKFFWDNDFIKIDVNLVIKKFNKNKKFEEELKRINNYIFFYDKSDDDIILQRDLLKDLNEEIRSEIQNNTNNNTKDISKLMKKIKNKKLKEGINLIKERIKLSKKNIIKILKIINKIYIEILTNNKISLSQKILAIRNIKFLWSFIAIKELNLIIKFYEFVIWIKEETIQHLWLQNDINFILEIFDLFFKDKIFYYELRLNPNINWIDVNNLIQNDKLIQQYFTWIWIKHSLTNFSIFSIPQYFIDSKTPLISFAKRIKYNHLEWYIKNLSIEIDNILKDYQKQKHKYVKPNINNNSNLNKQYLSLLESFIKEMTDIDDDYNDLINDLNKKINIQIKLKKLLF